MIKKLICYIIFEHSLIGASALREKSRGNELKKAMLVVINLRNSREVNELNKLLLNENLSVHADCVSYCGDYMSMLLDGQIMTDQYWQVEVREHAQRLSYPFMVIDAMDQDGVIKGETWADRFQATPNSTVIWVRFDGRSG